MNMYPIVHSGYISGSFMLGLGKATLMKADLVELSFGLPLV